MLDKVDIRVSVWIRYLKKTIKHNDPDLFQLILALIDKKSLSEHNDDILVSICHYGTPLILEKYIEYASKLFGGGISSYYDTIFYRLNVNEIIEKIILIC